MAAEFYYYKTLFNENSSFDKHPASVLFEGFTIEIESSVRRYMQADSFILTIRVNIFGPAIPKSPLPHCMDTQFIILGRPAELSHPKKDDFADLYYLAINNSCRKVYQQLHELGKTKLKLVRFSEILKEVKNGNIPVPSFTGA
jgi:hypothetical protein